MNVVGDEFETSSMSSLSSIKHLISDKERVPTMIETCSSRKSNALSACPSVCSSSESSCLSSTGDRSRKSQHTRYSTLVKGIITRLGAELEQTKEEMESNQTLSLLRERQESPRNILRGSLGLIQRLRFEMVNTDTDRDQPEEAEYDKTQTVTKETMVDVDLTDDTHTNEANTFKKDESEFGGSRGTMMTVEVPVEEEHTPVSSFRNSIRNSLRSSIGKKGTKLVSVEELLWDNDPLGSDSHQGMEKIEHMTSSRNNFWTSCQLNMILS
uniref:Uncharacterized protein n=1 Tax=Ditylum brightwellii TaxID=49249 RepID=A0A7S4QUN8_9STRA